MRAVMLEVPESLLEERRAKGWDRNDEVWAGVLHMVPPASFRHYEFEFELAIVLRAVALRRGLRTVPETGLFDPVQGARDYRKPDITVTRSDAVSARGIEGRAELVVEVLSPDDESREKLPFYARVGVREVWLVDPTTREVEVFALESGTYRTVHATAGVIRSPALAIELAVVAGPKLQIRDGDDVVEL